MTLEWKIRPKKSAHYKDPKKAHHVCVVARGSPICGVWLEGRMTYHLVDKFRRPRVLLDLDDLLCDECLKIMFELLAPFPMSQEMSPEDMERLKADITTE